MTPRTTFQIVRMASWVIEKAAMSSADAWLRNVATSSAWVWPTPPGVIANKPDSMCEAATMKTVKGVTGIENAAMKTTFTPMRQQ